MKYLFRGVLALAVLLEAGCTIPRYISAEKDPRYTGVKMEDWETSPNHQGRTIRILLVHGMDNQPFGNDDKDASQPQLFGAPTYQALQKNLETLDSALKTKVINAAVSNSWGDFIKWAAQRLGNTEADETDYQFQLIKGGDGMPVGYTFTRTYKPNANGVSLKFYIANWGLGAAVAKERRFGSWGCLTTYSPAAHQYTEGQIHDFDSGLNRNRAWLNKMLKLQTMDWGLGDAALYLGDSKPDMQVPVTKALEQVLDDSKPDDRLAIITHSLGSTITFDAIAPLVSARPEMRALFRASDGTGHLIPSHTVFYMFANQYGLLTLGDKTPLDGLDDALKCTTLRAGREAVQVYAFTDPNDLLSYPLYPDLARISACNVYVRNEAVTLTFGTDPLETHLNYQSNYAVHNVMMDGLPKEK